MSSTRTTTRSSTNNRGRNRGGGRGRHNSNFAHQNEVVVEDHPYNFGRRGSPPTLNRGNRSNRGHASYRANNSSNSRFNISDNNEQFLPSDSNSSRIPKHAQTPFFVGELMSRFNNMLPSSMMLEDEVPDTQQPNVSQYTNPNPVSNIHNLDMTQNNNPARISPSFNSNKNPRNQVNYSNEDKIESSLRSGESPSYSSSIKGESKSVIINDNQIVNGSNGPITKFNHNKNSKHGPHSNIYNIKTSTSSKKLKNSPITVRKSSMEQRKAIMKQFGFEVESLNQKSVDSKTTDRNKQPQSSFADRISPRVRHSLENKLTQNILPHTISEQPGDEACFTQIDTVKRLGNGPFDMKSSSKNLGSDGKPGNCQETNEERISRNMENNFNPFFKPEQSTMRNYTQRSSSPKQKRQIIVSNDHNQALVLPANPRLMERDISGRIHFNVQRPLRDMNERVPSRAEALERYEEQYAVQWEEHEAKKREKEAKKREEYLAKYKHVDQGYRMCDGLLDEAAGYAPGYKPIETVEDVRQRQQDQLRKAAMAYQERRMKEEEKDKLMEEKRFKEKIVKNKHYDAGYRLGHGDNQGNSMQTASNRSTGFKNKRQKQNSQKSEISNKKDLKDSFSPELLLEGETEEEALQRQEEQLILEMVLQKQMEDAQEQKKFEKEDNCKEYECNQSQSSANVEVINQFQSIETARQTPKTPYQGLPSNFNSSHPGESSNKESNHSSAKYPPHVGNDNEQTIELMRNIGRSIQVEISNLGIEHLGITKTNISPHFELLGSKGSRNSELQVPASPQVTGVPEPLSKKPTSRVLKNPNGAVLVLRSTPEDLNQALVRRLEVLDEFDKLGYSTSYKPQAEQEPLYCNNRFERKQNFDSVKPIPTGAIPKTPYTSAQGPVSSGATYNSFPTTGAIPKTPYTSAQGPVSSGATYNSLPTTGAIPKTPYTSAQGPVSSGTTYNSLPTTGAIPKTLNTSAREPVSSDATYNSPLNNTCAKQEDVIIDHKAELRAARLKFQQQYEDALKKKLEQMNNNS